MIKRRWPHLIYVSDWHIHPGSFDQPSSHDLDMSRCIVSDDEWDSPAVVFPIGVIEEGRVWIPRRLDDAR